MDTATSGAALVAGPNSNPRTHSITRTTMNIKILSACFVPGDKKSGQPVLLEAGGVYSLGEDVAGELMAAGRAVETDESPAPAPESKGKKGGE